jgi:N-acetylmuramoyl-L-alanine amidase
MKKLTAALAVAISLLTLTSNAHAYDVKYGDTMSEIAQTHSLTLKELGDLNTQVADLDTIFVGQAIVTAAAGAEVAKVEAPVITSGVSEYEKDLLARLVRAEAQGEPYAGKVAVATVILNRVKSSDFPNSISEVILQKGQFSPVSNGAINRPADAESRRAADEALTLGNTASLFFYNARTASSRWLDIRPTTQVIGNHTFKK